MKKRIWKLKWMNKKKKKNIEREKEKEIGISNNINNTIKIFV